MFLNEISSYWIHDLSPFLWKFPGEWSSWGPGGIRWYGMAYLMGFITATCLKNTLIKEETLR